MNNKLDCNHMVPTSSSFTGYPDTYVKLAKDRIIFISEPITDILAAQLSALLLHYDHEDHNAMIEMYIHSPGGTGSGLVNIYDVMQMIKAPIKTVCLGKCHSAAAVILAAGSKGERYAFKNSNIMIHGLQCQFPIPGDNMVASKTFYAFLKNINNDIMKILAHHTGHPVEKVRTDCAQDVYLTSQEALDYGIIDYII